MIEGRFSSSPAVLLAALAAVLLVGMTAGCATGGGAGPEGDAGAESAVDRTRGEAPSKVVLAVRKPKHVKVAMMTARQMLSGEATHEAERVDIVACGPAIRALGVESKVAGQVKRSLEGGIRIKACGLTVEKMGFDRERFIDGVDVVPNGLTEIVRLQAEGFHSVEL